MLAAGGPGCSPHGSDLLDQDVTIEQPGHCQLELSPRCHPGRDLPAPGSAPAQRFRVSREVQSLGGGSESRGTAFGLHQKFPFFFLDSLLFICLIITIVFQGKF